MRRAFKWYLARAKKRHNIKSDRALSQALGIDGGGVHNYKRRNMLPSERTMIRLAALAGIPAKKALRDLAVWRAKYAEVKAAYEEQENDQGVRVCTFDRHDWPKLYDLGLNIDILEAAEEGGKPAVIAMLKEHNIHVSDENGDLKIIEMAGARPSSRVFAFGRKALKALIPLLIVLPLSALHTGAQAAVGLGFGPGQSAHRVTGDLPEPSLMR